MGATDPRIGAFLGDYRLVSSLGQGTAGVVYRAEHRETGALVALKTLTTPRIASLAALRREIRALTRLRHPGIVSIRGEGITDGLPWYVMDLIEGSPLGEWRESGQAPRLSSRLLLVRRVCHALAWLHGEGVVHRDLKPSNILVKPDGWPVLVDFGLSLRSERTSRDVLDVSESLVGTAAYLAPEQIRGETVDARADLYALGGVLYELVTGQVPFAGRSAREQLMAHLELPPPPVTTLVAELPSGLPELIHTLLEKHPQARPGHASAVARAVEGVLKALGIRPEPADAEASALPPARSYLYRPRLVGREALIRTLSTRLEQARDGEGGLWLLQGESGSGKTRLLLELAQTAQRLGFRVLTGESTPRLPPLGAVGHAETVAGMANEMADEKPDGMAAGLNRMLVPPLSTLQLPLASLADVCRQGGPALTERLLGARAQRLARYIPAFLQLPGMTETLEPVELPAVEQALALSHDLLEVLTAFSLNRPLFIALDDLQWTDELSLGFLTFLARKSAAQELPLVLVGGFRSDEAGIGLETLMSIPGVLTFPVSRLEGDSVVAMVQDMLAMPDPPERFTTFVRQVSEGAPFFVAEYLRMTMDEGLLFQDASGRWKVSEEVELEARYQALPLPETLRTLALRRLTQLTPEAFGLALTASVLGRTLERHLLQAMAELDLQISENNSDINSDGNVEWEAGLQELLRASILQDVPRGLSFSHDLLRETAYQQLGPEARQRLHGRAARVLSQTPEQGRQSLAMLGRHWLEAGEPGLARPYLLAAAREATTLGSLSGAEALYRCLLREAPGTPRELLEARVELALHVLLLRGKVLESKEIFEAGCESARGLNAPAQEAACLLGLAEVCQLVGRLEPIADLCEQALAIFRTLGDRSAQVKALHRLAIARFAQGQRTLARAMREEGLALARACGDRYHEAVMLMTLGGHYCREGALAAGAPLIELALQLRESIGDLPGAGHTLRTIAGFRLYEGALPEALRLTRLAQQRLEAAGAIRRLPYVLFNRTFLETAFGRLGRPELEGLHRQRRALERQLDDPRGRAVLGMAHLTLLWYEGQWSQALVRGPEVLQEIRSSGELEVEVQCYLRMAYTWLGKGDEGQARILAEEVLTRGDPRMDYAWLSEAHLLLAGLDRSKGALEQAEQRVRMAEQLLSAWPECHWAVLCRCERALIQRAGGQDITAEVQALEAYGVAQSVGPDSWMGRSLRALREALLPAGGRTGTDA